MVEGRSQLDTAQLEHESTADLSKSEPVELKMIVQICCVCGISDAHPVGVGEDFEYWTSPDTFVAVRCHRCGLVYLDPRPDDSELFRIYPSNYHAFAFKQESFGLIWRVRSWLETRRLTRWLHGLPADARILDVGCGDGFHLKLLQSVGNSRWSLEGIDADERAVHAAESTGLQVHQGRIEDNDFPPESYECVLLVMTLEHVSDPVETLVAIRRVLKPGGRLVVITDNTRTPHFWAFQGRHWGGYHFPRHWNLFDPASLLRTVDRAGFEVDEISTELNPVNWVYSIHNLLADFRAPRWLRRRFTLQSVGALSVFTLVDALLKPFGYGSILRAALRKPESREREPRKGDADSGANPASLTQTATNRQAKPDRLVRQSRIVRLGAPAGLSSNADTVGGGNGGTRHL